MTAQIDVSMDTFFNVLMDPEYRKVWDKDMIEGFDFCRTGDSSSIGYYAG